MLEEFLLCVIVTAIIILIIHIIDFSIRWIIHNKQMSTRKYDMDSVLDRWENAEKRFQKDNKTKTADPAITAKREPFKFGKLRIVHDKWPSSVSRYMNTRITLTDVVDTVKQYSSQNHSTIECSGCHTVCKDDCDMSCSKVCSVTCTNACNYACVGVCGANCHSACGYCGGCVGCSGKAIGVDTKII